MQDILKRAERLAEINRNVGATLWELQELESSCAKCFFLIAQATVGMGEEAGDQLLNKALGKTFGRTIYLFKEEEILPADLVRKLESLLKDRNWLVHSSRLDSRGAIYSDGKTTDLVTRLKGIADLSTETHGEIATLAENFVQKAGVPLTDIDRIAQDLLEQWHND